MKTKASNESMIWWLLKQTGLISRLKQTKIKRTRLKKKKKKGFNQLLINAWTLHWMNSQVNRADESTRGSAVYTLRQRSRHTKSQVTWLVSRDYILIARVNKGCGCVTSLYTWGCDYMRATGNVYCTYKGNIRLICKQVEVYMRLFSCGDNNTKTLLISSQIKLTRIHTKSKKIHTHKIKVLLHATYHIRY